ncbi:hypothetical protein PFNF135_04877 [Plasmodium falciparum NF135/5.C10]|uniref:Uncharacterized protein n=1 Tax=Plasmodium falciparum NF135/5.C10 TaxID=1036726 RepID=W4IA57_PLAFA|nr:hypothetical protein PFNF135_04877 [Plasmodium falciparum NF135/5.C10]
MKEGIWILKIIIHNSIPNSIKYNIIYISYFITYYIYMHTNFKGKKLEFLFLIHNFLYNYYFILNEYNIKKKFTIFFLTIFSYVTYFDTNCIFIIYETNILFIFKKYHVELVTGKNNTIIQNFYIFIFFKYSKKNFVIYNNNINKFSDHFVIIFI